MTSPEEISTDGTPIGSGGDDTKVNLKAVSNIIASEEPDGATLYTVCVSQICFKIGRITIPPEIVFAINGLTGLSSTTGAPFSPTNPPPHWNTVLSLSSHAHGGGRKKMMTFLKGGWKDVPENERWWTQAFVDLAERNAANLAEVEILKLGLEGARRVGLRA